MANYSLQNQRSINTFSRAKLFEALQGALGLQVFSDGGYAGGSGSIGVVFAVVRQSDHGLRVTPFAVLGEFIPEAKSAFQMETLALDAATEALFKACF